MLYYYIHSVSFKKNKNVIFFKYQKYTKNNDKFFIESSEFRSVTFVDRIETIIIINSSYNYN